MMRRQYLFGRDERLVPASYESIEDRPSLFVPQASMEFQRHVMRVDQKPWQVAL